MTIEITEKIIRRLINRWNRKKLITENGCWIVPKKLEKSGYIRVGIRINGQYFKIKLSRISAAFYHGFNINNEEQFICHKNLCNNKACWNPEHIYIGDKYTNAKDLKETGVLKASDKFVRHNSYKTHCKRGHLFDDTNTYKTRLGRSCKLCRNLLARRFRANRKLKQVL